MGEMVARFLERPLVSRHFADQYFLRAFVWPFARRDLLQHDSQFGFGDHRPFPDGLTQHDFHIGECETVIAFSAPIKAPDGTQVTWCLVHAGTSREPLTCAYRVTVRNNTVGARIPRRYADLLDRGTLKIRLVAGAGAES